jgi:hypothetical protein
LCLRFVRRQLRRVIVHGLTVNDYPRAFLFSAKNAMAIRATPQLAQKLVFCNSDLGQIDHPFVRWDLKGFPKPTFWIWKIKICP